MFPHQIYALLVYASQLVQPPDSNQNHWQLLYQTGCQLYFNAVFYLSICDQSECVLSYEEKSMCINAPTRKCCTLDNYICWSDKVYYFNANIVTKSLSALISGCLFEISSLRTSALKSPNKIFMWDFGNSL